MRLSNYFGIIFVIGLVAAAPSTNNTEDDILIVNSDLFINEFLVYTSEYDIVGLTVPLNAINVDKFFDDSNSEYTIPLYFVEAAINERGHKDYKGLYSLKNGEAIKVLETGTDAATSDDDTTYVYFSAKDGIYAYNMETNNTEKYGTVADSLISIVKSKGSDVLYVLTDNHYVYKVTDGGNKKEKLQEIKDARQIVLDFSNNLYFYSEDKIPYVKTTDGIKKIIGLPENPTYVQLIKPPFLVENGAIFAADDKVYIIYSNGTSELTDVVLQVKPTAYAPEAAFIQYYGYNKKIYEYSTKKLRLVEVLLRVKKLLEDKANELQPVETQFKSHVES